MSFRFKAMQSNAGDVQPEVQFSAGHEREAEILDIIKTALEDLTHKIGGHVAFGASGHVNEVEGLSGDNVNIQVNGILPPVAPVRDAGFAAAAGSAQNFPPEATTAAPATQDDSPPAAQEPIPQPSEIPDPSGNEPASSAPTDEKKDS